MNDFTKEELVTLLAWGIDRAESIDPSDFEFEGSTKVYLKIQSMIDNYGKKGWDEKKIANAHLIEAESLISHARCLLGMDDE